MVQVVTVLYLHQNLQPVQRRRAGPGHGAGASSSHQVAPPHARLLLLCGELVRDDDALANVQDLWREAVM